MLVISKANYKSNLVVKSGMAKQKASTIYVATYILNIGKICVDKPII